MKLMLTLESKPAKTKISYDAPIVFIGSCFSDNMGGLLAKAKFPVCYNVTGIAFDPLSIGMQLTRAIQMDESKESELVFMDELWHSWFYHSKLSASTKDQVLENIQKANQQLNQTLSQASHLFITLGTSFSYVLSKEQLHVANCHKAPKSFFEKKLLSITEMVGQLKETMQLVRAFNPTIEIVITVSPVKHLRDGIEANNRSKARLIEVANQLSDEIDYCTYFPAYELVTEVLRDYRFYAKDLAHPNELAIDEVFDFFCQTYLDKTTQQQMNEIMHLVNALQHKPLHPNSLSHQQFLKQQLEHLKILLVKFPQLDWENELKILS